jgi:hypothetical protein
MHTAELVGQGIGGGVDEGVARALWGDSVTARWDQSFRLVKVPWSPIAR